jgi:hypothetical protein
MNTSALVETSDKLCKASPSNATEPERIAITSSIKPVRASPIALTATARLACAQPAITSRNGGC